MNKDKGKHYNYKGDLIEKPSEDYVQSQKKLNNLAYEKYDDLRKNGYTNSRALAGLESHEKCRVQNRNHKK
jgi:hypothetical protein